jgi:hypothetical protein
MGKVDRLLCHPYRVFVNEPSEVLVKKDNEWKYHEGENVIIPVDPLEGNPDPYVFHNPWFYGYCRNHNMPNQTGAQSIIIFGTYLKDKKGKESFLVDTVFVVGARYEWLGKEDGYLPSETFRRNYHCLKNSKLYKDFIIHRVEKGHHPRAKAIFAAGHTKRDDFYNLVQIPHKREENFYSFIPLHYEDDIYKLIDILPIIKQKYPTLLDNYDSRRNRLYNIDSAVVSVIDNLIMKANRLVIGTAGKGMPEKLDMNLQKKYYKYIYNILDEVSVEKSCKEICYSIGENED